MTVRQWQFSETFIWTFNKNNFIYLKSIETEILLLLSYSPNIHTVKTKPGRCQESHTPSGSPVSVAGAQLMGQHAAIPVHRQMNWNQNSHDSNPFDQGCGYHMQWLIPLCYLPQLWKFCYYSRKLELMVFEPSKFWVTVLLPISYELFGHSI